MKALHGSKIYRGHSDDIDAVDDVISPFCFPESRYGTQFS
jgi:hypothetical protein